MTDIATKRPNRDRVMRYLECRSLGHEWHRLPPIGVDDTSDQWRRPFGYQTGMMGIPSHCQNCGKDKIRWITRSGESITRYADPEGYAKHGDDVRSVREYRSEYVETLFTSFEAATTAAMSTSTRTRGRKRA